MENNNNSNYLESLSRLLKTSWILPVSILLIDGVFLVFTVELIKKSFVNEFKIISISLMIGSAIFIVIYIIYLLIVFCSITIYHFTHRNEFLKKENRSMYTSLLVQQIRLYKEVGELTKIISEKVSEIQTKHGLPNVSTENIDTLKTSLDKLLIKIEEIKMDASLEADSKSKLDELKTQISRFKEYYNQLSGINNAMSWLKV